MKILKIFGVVVGIHVFALILIFANPGCSSTSKPAGATTGPSAQTSPAATPPVTPAAAPVTPATDPSPPIVSVPSSFNPDAPASSSNTPHYAPTRPNTSAASTLVAEPVSDVTPATPYTVKSGDNLWTLAKKNGLTAAQLAAANNIKVTAVLHDGQKLLIPGKTPPPASAHTAAASGKPAATAAAAAPKPAAEGVKHTVKPGDTLGSIAKTYGVKQRDIAVANNIADPMKLPIGKVLTIPGWKAPAAGTAKSSASTSTTKSTTGGASTASASKPQPQAAPVEPATPLFSAPSSPTSSSPIQSVPPPASTGNPISAAPALTGSEPPVIPVTEAPAKKP
jgi:LysM repeat protein